MKRIMILVVAVMMITAMTAVVASEAFAAPSCAKIGKKAHKKQCQARNFFFPGR